MEKQEELGKLWKKTSIKGNEYFIGKITIDGKTTRIVIFKIMSADDGAPFLKIVQSRYESDRE